MRYCLLTGWHDVKLQHCRKVLMLISDNAVSLGKHLPPQTRLITSTDTVAGLSSFCHLPSVFEGAFEKFKYITEVCINIKLMSNTSSQNGDN